MAKRDEIVVGLDLGTTKVSAVVAEQTENAPTLNVLGVGSAECSGIKQGAVVSIDATVKAIGEAVAAAEAMSGVDIHAVVAGVSGTHMRGLNNRAGVGVKGERVTMEDIGNVLEQVRAVELGRDDEVIQVVPRHYTLDSQSAIGNPLGMVGDRLSVEAHVVIGAASSVQNLLTCVERAGLQVDHLAPQQLASAHAVLSPEELELGVALLDIGGGTTDMAVFTDGALCHTWVLPLGGTHVTRDVSHGLSTPVRDAERIKVRYGTALTGEVDPSEQVEVPGVGGREGHSAERRLLADIIGARVEEILELAAEELHRSGLSRRIGSGLVVTGGGSLLPGLTEVARRITGLPCRRGTPVALAGLVELAANPKNATAVGLARLALAGLTQGLAEAAPPRGVARITRWMQTFF
ncbi:MAG: cell division protein FtsA [Nitrospirota bacterium]|nr:cell division protein FtsA [Nitrospirota bacterium]